MECYRLFVCGVFHAGKGFLHQLHQAENRIPLFGRAGGKLPLDFFRNRAVTGVRFSIQQPVRGHIQRIGDGKQNSDIHGLPAYFNIAQKGHGNPNGFRQLALRHSTVQPGLFDPGPDLLKLIVHPNPHLNQELL